MKLGFVRQPQVAIAMGLLLGATAVTAQPGPTFGGGFPQFGGGQQSSSTQRSGSSGSRTTYPSSTDIGNARITYDPETRSLIVVADDETATHIKGLVSDLDRPTPQVLIKCVFLEAQYSKDLDLGVEGVYKHTVSTKLDAVNGSGIASTAFDLAASGGMYQLLGKDVQITISALAKAGKTEILSRPSVLARNNQQATISVGQRVPLISGVTFDTFGNQRNAINYEDVGIILRVTPFISSDGMVEMVLSPEISSISDSSVNFATGTTNIGSSSASAPIINRRSADTVTVVPDGQTVVIGGMMQRQAVSTEQKVPLLGDIPLLGALFRHKITSNVKTELMVFITPYIVKDPRDLAAVTETDKAKEKIRDKKTFSEKELNEYLDTIPPAGTTETPKKSRQ